MGLAVHLAELEQVPEYAIARDEPDPRGWPVIACDAQQVGIVRTLIVDTGLMRARYFVCELKNGGYAALPVAYARLDLDSCRVIFDVADARTFHDLPAYRGAPPNPEEAATIDRILVGGVSAATPGDSQDRRQMERRSDVPE
ncbi:MAG TPA: PRC-barrel domain-containing protein [Longimicrobiales bacterium]|nr:PRC-barrel domain-containing protein [Longimicrobiales bacterium]